LQHISYFLILKIFYYYK